MSACRVYDVPTFCLLLHQRTDVTQATRTRRKAALPLLGRRRDTPCRRAGPAKTLAQTRERPAETGSTRLRASASCCRGYLLRQAGERVFFLGGGVNHLLDCVPSGEGGGLVRFIYVQYLMYYLVRLYRKPPVGNGDCKGHFVNIPAVQETQSLRFSKTKVTICVYCCVEYPWCSTVPCIVSSSKNIMYLVSLVFMLLKNPVLK